MARERCDVFHACVVLQSNYSFQSPQELALSNFESNDGVVIAK